MVASPRDAAASLAAAGLPAPDIAALVGAWPEPAGTPEAAACSRFWRLTDRLAAELPPKPQRGPAQQAAQHCLAEAGRELRERFLQHHAAALYRQATTGHTRFLRILELLAQAATLVEGLLPTQAALQAQRDLKLKDQDGLEIDQGLFLAHVLADPQAGAHLCHAMLLPRPEAAARLGEFIAQGRVDLGAARVERSGAAAVVTFTNPRFLNAEDETTLDACECAIDLALLDPGSAVAVLRGGVVTHPKYAGRRLFSAGINLTHLYQGRIRYAWYIERDMGLVNKIFRGLAREDASPDELRGATIEKPWIAAVDGFAIGGGCQLLLATDYVLAAEDAYLTLPARKEGIIPGAANLRLPRFTGDRIARQAILHGRRLDAATPEGRLICDEVVQAAAMDTAIERVIGELTGSGMVSAAANRRALRVGQEPLDLFRRYMAVYCREQAYCHFSPALIANLERHWDAPNRAG